MPRPMLAKNLEKTIEFIVHNITKVWKSIATMSIVSSSSYTGRYQTRKGALYTDSRISRKYQEGNLNIRQKTNLCSSHHIGLEPKRKSSKVQNLWSPRFSYHRYCISIYWRNNSRRGTEKEKKKKHEKRGRSN
jgi:hypothetical protein